MFRLNFTTPVMGEDGAEKVRRQGVFQTLRSERDDIVVALKTRTLIVGDEMEVALDGEVVGKASPLMIDRIAWGGITLIDAREGGFTSIPELNAALQRAGYRFKPMNTYRFYRVQFQWLNER